MKLKRLILVLFAITTSLFFNSCESNDISTSKVQLKLVDSEGEYTKVLVNIIDVKYNRSDDESGWVSFEGFTLPDTNDPLNRVDLTELIAGNSLVLTNEDLESGMLKQIRLILGEGNAIVLDEETEERPLDTPSALQSGLKLQVNANLEPGFSYTFILDWDVQKSIVAAGASGKYILKPVINVIAEVNSGVISGRVADVEETEESPMPLENAIVSVYNESDNLFENPITSTFTVGTGNFVLYGLPEGKYNLRITKSEYIDYEYSEVINLVKGEEIALEVIKMTKSI